MLFLETCTLYLQSDPAFHEVIFLLVGQDRLVVFGRDQGTLVERSVELGVVSSQLFSCHERRGECSSAVVARGEDFPPNHEGSAKKDPEIHGPSDAEPRGRFACEESKGSINVAEWPMRSCTFWGGLVVRSSVMIMTSCIPGSSVRDLLRTRI